MDEVESLTNETEKKGRKNKEEKKKAKGFRKKKKKKDRNESVKKVWFLYLMAYQYSWVF